MITRKEAVGWDALTWQRALLFWEQEALPQLPSNACGLEIGAFNGLLCAYFAQKGYRMICSDITAISDETRTFHREKNLDRWIEYETFNAENIPFPDHSFDFIIFKSVLGAIGRNGRKALQQRSVLEMHRVLKPGGMLLFAENLESTVFHRLARRQFKSWGNSWRYVKRSEMNEFLAVFGRIELRSTGFFAAFVPKPLWLKNLISRIDAACFFLPERWHYVCYGFAVK